MFSLALTIIGVWLAINLLVGVVYVAASIFTVATAGLPTAPKAPPAPKVPLLEHLKAWLMFAAFTAAVWFAVELAIRAQS